MKSIGTMCKCDRCGKHAFVEGGNKPRLPETWSHVDFVGDLCRDCNDVYETLVHAFMKKDKITIDSLESSLDVEVRGI